MYAKINISGSQPNFIKILKRINIKEFKIDRLEKSINLQVKVPDTDILVELIRRLKPKRMRKGTNVILLEADSNG